MKRSLFTTLALLIVVAALAAWYTLYEKQYRPDQAKAEEKAKGFVTLAVSEVQELELDIDPSVLPETEKNKKLRKMPALKAKLKKSGDGWNLLEPLEDKADTATISGMLTTLVGARYARVVDEAPSDLKQYGLDTPFIKVRVRKDSASPWQELHIGNRTPVGFNCYVKVAAKTTVYRTNYSTRSGFEKEIVNLRNRKFLSLAKGQVHEIEIKNPKETFLLTRREGSNEWRLARENIPVDSNEWNKTLNSIFDLKATHFPDATQPLRTYGLHRPKYQITFRHKTDKTKTQTILLTKKKVGTEEKMFVKVAGGRFIYQISSGIFTRLDTPSREYRDMSLAKFNRFDVQRVKLVRGKETLEFQKESGTWSLPAEPGLSVDNTKVDTLLTRLQDTKITRFLPKNRHPGKTPPALKIHLFEKKKGGEEKESVVLQFSPPHSKRVVVLRTGLDSPLEVKEDDLKALNLAKDKFLKKQKKAKQTGHSPKKS